MAPASSQLRSIIEDSVGVIGQTKVPECRQQNDRSWISKETVCTVQSSASRNSDERQWPSLNRSTSQRPPVLPRKHQVGIWVNLRPSTFVASLEEILFSVTVVLEESHKSTPVNARRRACTGQVTGQGPCQIRIVFALRSTVSVSPLRRPCSPYLKLTSSTQT